MMRSGKHILAVIVHTIRIAKKAAKDGQAGILMSFGVIEQTLILAAYGITKIFPYRKNNF